jgi:signal transduction histidine kinase
VNSANVIKREVTGLSRHYQNALRGHLKRSCQESLEAAQDLGRQAMAIGLETLDLAGIHEQALVGLVLPSAASGARAAMVRHAGAFFSRGITPIEKTHRTALETNDQIGRLKQALRQRVAALAASKQRLKEQIAQRHSAEESLRKSEQHYSDLLQQSTQMQDQLRLLSRQLLSAQEEERKKISRELHDVIAQTLTSINVHLATLQRKAALKTGGLERSIARTQRLVVHSVAIVHEFARELRPAALDDLGLIPALHAFMKKFSSETGIHVSLSVFAGAKHLNSETRTALYRVAQEALTNVGRHAHASRAEVNLQKVSGVVFMTVKDDGRGFEREQTLRAKKGKRLGLLGMRERLEMVGGKLTITTGLGKGTSIQAEVPLINKRTMGGGAEAGLITSDELEK